MNAFQLSVASLFSVIFLTGCSARPHALLDETAACHKYHAMMTAPLPPDAMHRMAADCMKSEEK
ncbi:MAG: hypothetical protein ABF739_00960 [Acetobacter okinawensis]